MNRFKEQRILNGYKSQKELADVIFVNQTAVSQWERGVTTPSSQMLQRLSELYKVSIDYLLGLIEAPSPHYIRRTDLLRRRGISYSDLSKKTGISVYRLRRYFSEESLGSTDFLSEYPKLARALGVSPQYLYGLTDQENDELDTDERFCDWVMGHLNDEKKEEPTPVAEDGLSEAELRLVELYRDLNHEGQEKLIDYADDLVASGKYIKSHPAELGKEA